MAPAVGLSGCAGSAVPSASLRCFAIAVATKQSNCVLIQLCGRSLRWRDLAPAVGGYPAAPALRFPSASLRCFAIAVATKQSNCVLIQLCGRSLRWRDLALAVGLSGCAGSAVSLRFAAVFCNRCRDEAVELRSHPTLRPISPLERFGSGSWRLSGCAGSAVSLRFAAVFCNRCRDEAVELRSHPTLRPISPLERFGSGSWIRTNDLVVNSHPSTAELCRIEPSDFGGRRLRLFGRNASENWRFSRWRERA